MPCPCAISVIDPNRIDVRRAKGTIRTNNANMTTSVWERGVRRHYPHARRHYLLNASACLRIPGRCAVHVQAQVLHPTKAPLYTLTNAALRSVRGCRRASEPGSVPVLFPGKF